MNELLCAAAALASLLGLTHWARGVPTRAWGDVACASTLRSWTVVLGTLLLQTAAATAASGWTAGIAQVLAAWMVLGWLLVLAMNQWPQVSLRWAMRVGWAAGGVCVLALIVHALSLAGAH